MRKVLLVLIAATIFQVYTTQPATATTLIIPGSHILPSSNDPDPAKVKAAVEQFKNLSKHEKKVKMKEIKKQVREYKKAKKAGKDEGTNTLLLIIVAILLPPLAVALHQQGINSKFWICLLLTLLFYLPGLIYALVVILG